MRSICEVSLLTLGLSVLLPGCGPTPDPGDGNGYSSGPATAAIELGETGVFSEGLTGAPTHDGVFDISDKFPVEEPVAARLFIDAEDITVGTADDIAAGTAADAEGLPDAVVSVSVLITPADEPEPCSVLGSNHFFNISIESGQVVGIEPESEQVSTEDFARLRDGAFSLCVVAYAEVDFPLTVAALGVRFVSADEVTANNCDEILALPQVQSAIDRLAGQRFEFELPAAGTGTPDLEGDYVLSETILFDPDTTNMGETNSTNVTLLEQTDTTIGRAVGEVSITQFIQGNASTIGLCTLQRTNSAACDQTIARLESLAIGTNGGGWSGRFLSVAVQRHSATDETCGTTGDFIYGSMSMVSADEALIRLRGKVTLGPSFYPGLIVLPPAGGKGTVADRASTAAAQFPTDAPFTTGQTTLAETIAIPAEIGAEGISALGMSRDGSRLVIVTDSPDAAAVYDNDTLATIRVTQSTTADFLGGVVDFNLDTDRLYVPTIDPARITILRSDDSSGADEVRRLTTPASKLPVQARISPDGTQVAVLLEDGAPIGQGGQLAFLDVAGERFLQPPIDLVEDAGGTALASEIVYSADGSLVFLAGLGAVVAIETESPYTITTLDVSDGAGDNPVALALSNDGEVLAVAVDDSASTVDFAVVDVATLTTVHTQNLGLFEGGALDMAHFHNGRVAVVANFDSSVVAVQTAPPYTVSAPLSAAGVAGSTALGRVVSGGDVVAVTNLDEPAVYIFELSSTTGQ